jgi:poly(A) polymerase
MKALLDHPLLATLANLSHNFPGAGGLYLVGGALRDALLHRPVADFDFTSAADPTPLAQALARQLGSHWFWLDEPRRQSRVMAGEVTCDFATFRAPSLAEDLAARDFTINAMAIDLAGPVSSLTLIDPRGGRTDLSAGILRCAGPGVLLDDPLRILKGIRHALELDLTVEPATLAAMQTAAALLPGVAPERLRLELWRILAVPSASPGWIDLLVQSGAGGVLLGLGPDPVKGELCRRSQRADDLIAALSAASPVIAERLHEPVEQWLDRATLLRWHYLLDAIDRELPLTLARRWHFSRNAIGRLAALRAIVPELWRELLVLPAAPRPLALWARQFSPNPVDLLLALALLHEDEPSATVDLLISWFLLLTELADPRQVPPLVAGGWLQHELGMEGEAIGAAQADLCRAEIRGEVRDAGEASRYLLARHPKNG